METDGKFTRKYLKTVDFINTKYIMLKINPFLPPRISPTNTNLYDRRRTKRYDNSSLEPSAQVSWKENVVKDIPITVTY